MPKKHGMKPVGECVEATDGMDPPVDAKPIMDTSSALPGNRLAGGDTEEDVNSPGGFRGVFTPEI